MHNKPERPADAKNWTWDDVDDAVREIGELQRTIKTHAATCDVAIAAIKDQFETGKKKKNTTINTLVKQIKKGFKANEAGLNGAKSKALAYGTVGARVSPSSLKRHKGVSADDAIARIKARGWKKDLIKSVETIRVEVLETKKAVVIADSGFYWTKPKATFFVEVTADLQPNEKLKTA